MRTDSEQTKVTYLNRAQQYALALAANTEIDICSRRFGKSFGIVSRRIKRNVMFMPGSTGAFVASSFKQALTRTLPAALSGLREAGFIEGIHYVIGKRPPARLGFGKPNVPVQDFDNVVTFYNGTQMIIISQDVKMSSNSLTLDWVVGDEAKGLDFEKLKDETFPANGGTMRFYADCPWHHSILFVSDMPVLKSANWLLNYREKATTEVNEAIMALLVERYPLAMKEALTPGEKRRLQDIDRTLSGLRRIAVAYNEWSIFENIDVVGIQYIKKMKRDLPPLVFQTSILSRRIEKLADGFYPNFRESLHTYVANNNSLLESTGLKTDTASLGCLLDGDLDLKAPISVAFDYNANINWLVCGQRQGSVLKVLKSFYVKYQRKLRELVDDFCAYYQAHLCKEIILYYDSTALGSNYAVSDDDFKSIIVQQFNKHGWSVDCKFIGKPLPHNQKYSMLNDGFTGSKNLMPMFNKENNEALITAISLAEVEINRLGFHKRKAGEKLMESEDDPLEFRTDGTDAFDTLYIGNVLYPYSSYGVGIGSAL